MMGLPADTDFSAFIGREVTIVRMGKFLLHYFLREDKPTKPDAWLEIESNKLMYTDASGKPTAISDFKTNAGLLCGLLGLEIKGMTRLDDGGLRLEMSSGERLDIGIHASNY